MLRLSLLLLVALHQFKGARQASALDSEVPYYADLDSAEGSFLFTELLSSVDACGRRLLWRDRAEFIGKRKDTEKLKGQIILVTKHGPTTDELEYFKNTPRGQQIILLHHSDEDLAFVDLSAYGPGISQVFRNYYFGKLGEKAMKYLAEGTDAGVPRIAWMPVGLANLRKLPAAFQLEFTKRPYLWSWVGATDSFKPERKDMVNALKSHSKADQIMKLGVLKSVISFAGNPDGSQGSVNPWEYSFIMQQAQFAPIPAGVSPEQFRLWEAFEAGKA